MDILFKIINFCIFLGVLVYFLRRPFKEFLKNRHEDLNQLISSSQKTYDTALSEAKNWLRKMEGIEIETAELINDFKNEGALEREIIVERSRKYSEQMINDAHRIIDDEKLKAIDEIKRKIVSDAIDLVKRRLIKETSLAEQIKMSEGVTREIEKSV